MSSEPQKPEKTDYILVLWISAAGAGLGLTLNVVANLMQSMETPLVHSGLNLIKALGF